MRNFSLLFVILLLPLPCAAQEVSFLIEQAYASSEVQIEGGVAAPQSSSIESVTKETVTSPSVVIPSSAPSVSSKSSAPSVSSASSESDNLNLPTDNVVPKAPSQPAVPLSTIDQEEQDELTLEQLEEYAKEASENIEELIEALEKGFTITSTSSLGSPLPSTQRTAILRRNVRTVPQLKLFARALAESNPLLRKIDIVEDKITVSYRRKAWILGFIPLNFIFETTVVADTVEVDKPWWLVLSRNTVGKDVEVLQQNITTIEDTNVLSRMQKILQAMSDVLNT